MPTPVSPEEWARHKDGGQDQDNVRAALELEVAADAPERSGHPVLEPRDYPIYITGSVLITRPPEEVFAFVGKLENDPQWLPYDGIVAVRFLDDGPVDVGTHTELTLRILGRRVQLVTVITDYVPDVRVSHRSVSGRIQFHARRGVEAAPGGTRFTYTYGIDISVSYRHVRAAVARVAQRGLDLQLVALKKRLELREP